MSKERITRREFLNKAVYGGIALTALGLGSIFDEDEVSAQEAGTATSAPTRTPEVRVTQVPESLAYPAIQHPEPSRQFGFPNELVAYESPFEDGDYFEDGQGDIDVSQYYYRVMTAGTIIIEELGVTCEATDSQGCLVIIVNHFGPTAMFRNAQVDNGFTVAGRVFDMATPEKTIRAGQALLDHYAGRMTASEDGANCGTIDACESVDWHFVVIGNGQLQSHSSGVYTRPERTPTTTPTATATLEN